MAAVGHRDSKQACFDKIRAGMRAGLLLVFLPVFLCVNAVRAQTKAIEKARQLLLQGSNQQAAQILEGEIKSHPEESEAHLLLGQIYALEERRADSIQELSRAVELCPDSATSYNMLGSALSRFAEFEAARKAYEQAVALDPNLVEARINLGMSLAQANDMTMALLYKLDRALRKTGDTAGAEQVRAQAQLLLTHDDYTNQHFSDAEEIEHSAIDLEQRGDLAHAVAKYRAAVEMNPQQARYRYNYGLALCRLARFREGIAALHEVLENDPGNIDARHALFIAEDKARQAAERRP
jgi:Tfp pilus assembly protein PilF